MKLMLLWFVDHPVDAGGCLVDGIFAICFHGGVAGLATRCRGVSSGAGLVCASSQMVAKGPLTTLACSSFNMFELVV
eukprot:1350204-Amphidinium_carterae.1